MPRRPPRLSAVGSLDEIGEESKLAIDALSREACPSCGRPTLTATIVMRSGVRIECEGLDPHGDDGACQFTKYCLLSSERDLPRTDITGPEAS